MKVVVRTKTHQIDFGPEARHYVAETNEQGHVLKLVENRDDALKMTEAGARRILAYHNGRANAGTFHVLDA